MKRITWDEFHKKKQEIIMKILNSGLSGEEAKRQIEEELLKLKSTYRVSKKRERK